MKFQNLQEEQMKPNQKPQGQLNVFIERAKFRESTDGNKTMPWGDTDLYKMHKQQRQLTLVVSFIVCDKQASTSKHLLPAIFTSGMVESCCV